MYHQILKCILFEDILSKMLIYWFTGIYQNRLFYDKNHNYIIN